MDKRQAKEIIRETFESPFDKVRFTNFIKNLLNRIDESKAFHARGDVKEMFRNVIKTYERVGTFITPDDKRVDILIVYLQKGYSLDHARVTQRNFAGRYLTDRGEKDTGLFAFVSPEKSDWRFSLVKMGYKFEKTKSGRMEVKEKFTPARRWSFLVGANEKSHTAQNQLVNILKDDEHDPTLEEIEKAFDIETVTKEFFLKYRELFLRTKEELDKVVKNDPKIKADFEKNGVDTVNFAKKLLGQIIFLYFLQKKGWFGVGRNDVWGTGSKHFLRELFKKKHGDYKNFFNDILESLFYEALRMDRSHDDNYYSRFDCKIPFLNGGLFDPIGNYDWVHTDIIIPDKLFSNNIKTKEGDAGTGILDVFDRYNFTVKEDEPLEKEVAIDPELLGKSYEKFNAIRPDNFDEFKKALKSGKKGEENKFNKKFGVYYTPREIVHYMCQQSLINYLATEMDGKVKRENIEFLILEGEKYIEHLKTAKAKKEANENYRGDYKEKEHFIVLKKHASEIDDSLSKIKVCDPAVGSGAFPVGMMTEIIKSRMFFVETGCLEEIYINSLQEEIKRGTYNYKRDCIEHSLYGVDIDPGAVEIAKLRLWLSLVVDEEDIKNIKPLPNLDYKIVCGNSLLGVEKNLFNNELFKELEKLKPLFFNETNPTKKRDYKNQIDKLISEITNGHTEFDFEVYFSEVFHHKGGFDVVIANPPYLGEKGKKEIFREIKQGQLSKYYHGRMDLFYFFLHLALNLGKQDCLIAFITTNYYLTAYGARNLRRDLKNRSIIRKLVNLNELRIFESALGQHNIISILTKGNDDGALSHNCITKREGIATSQTINNIIGWKDEITDYYEVKQRNLYEGKENYIRLQGNTSESGYPIQKILAKVKSQGVPLDTFCNVNNGLRSGIDRVKDNNGQSKGVFILNDNEIKEIYGAKGTIDNIVKQYFKNSDISKYITKENSVNYVIYSGKNTNIRNNERIYTHLMKYKKIIKEKRWKEKIPWYALVRARKEAIFQSPKIVCPQRSITNTFGYNDVNWYAGSDVFFITQKVNYYQVNLKYILALLNSKLFYIWLYYKGKRKGKMLELIAIPVSEIPIKEISEELQKPFINCVNQILIITRSEDYPGNQQKQAKVKALEAEIDQLVYKLYDLTPEEIKIVEGETMDKNQKQTNENLDDDSEMESNKKEEIICPNCGAPMVFKKGDFNDFYICSRFPECRKSINASLIDEVIKKDK